ncbi:unnamed protein product, partial [Heligmosomoides polygyrus]|uniref:Helix-turn-helix domain-containing protein n=1 Tax=Heligmosomoides polygyrus TaxID=6339 RepID=A0A183GJC1_HELPZ
MGVWGQKTSAMSCKGCLGSEEVLRISCKECLGSEEVSPMSCKRCACVMSRESERITVVELHKTGMRTADIVRTTGFKQRTVYKI